MEKKRLFIGIDNGKQGATAIIDENQHIVEVFKYDEKVTTKLYDRLRSYTEEYELCAFVEKPIVVYGLAHQTSPFETIGRHKMTLEILNIPYRLGDPAATSSTNWKKIIGLFEDAKSASTKNTKKISDFNKKAREIKVQAELLGYSVEDLKSGKIAYMEDRMAELSTRYREIQKEIGKLKKEKKHDVKQTSVDACLQRFPESIQYIEKSGRAIKNKYDDDMAEAILLAECGRTLYANGNF
jgi:hypothetical protein